MSTTLPPRLAARDNPFRAQRLEALDYRLPGGVEELLDRFDALGRRAAIIGGHGSGKTALLAAVVPRLVARGLEVAALRLRRGERRLGPTGERWLGRAAPGVVMLLDGSDELGVRDWSRVLLGSRRASGLLVATHRRSLLPTLYRCRPSAVLLGELMHDLHRGCACTLPPADELLARHAGNLREALRELYDLHAGPAADE
jgi:hypothetical protein